ncbi:MAG TPA: Sec-independent protein translocase protein TatB [Candidatus Polarisedimenticolia bacterium]|nr:Sec-independent protein translocase protein TatB [Candidatus Polarisedimenticolia bacterium]
MFGPIGGFELIVLAVLGLLVFGPRRLPEIGRTLGRAMMEFRRAATELRTSIEREINLEEMQETTRSLRSIKEEVDRQIAGPLRTLDAAAGPEPPARPGETMPDAAPASPPVVAREPTPMQTASSDTAQADGSEEPPGSGAGGRKGEDVAPER